RSHHPQGAARRAGELNQVNPTVAGGDAAAETKRRLAALAVGAIGVVYGDIGTSPLYTLQTTLSHDGMHPTPASVYGVLSLIFWAQILVVSLKYVVFIMRADNKGEGGIMALMALAQRCVREQPRLRWVLVILGIFGASLFYGDGVITPAISVLGAVEGVSVVTPGLSEWVVPLTVVVLILLFLLQRHGTERVGKLFGPVMMVWFVVIALLGANMIARHPQVLYAVYPGYAVKFFFSHGIQAFIAPCGVVWLRASGVAAELFWAGRAAVDAPGGDRQLVLQAGAFDPAVPDDRAGHRCGSDRLAGGDLRRVLDDPRGDVAGLFDAHADRAYLARDVRADLRALGQQLPAADGAVRGAAFRQLRKAERGLWHRRDRYHEHHHGAGAGRGAPAVALETAGGDRGGRAVPGDRPVVVAASWWCARSSRAAWRWRRSSRRCASTRRCACRARRCSSPRTRMRCRMRCCTTSSTTRCCMSATCC